jgi:hypothetical protein
MPSWRARRYMRAHHSSSEMVRNRPAISHQPPWLSGGSASPNCGGGGSSASQNSWRMNWIGSQPTCASMLKPMMLNDSVPKISDAMPSGPR